MKHKMMLVDCDKRYRDMIYSIVEKRNVEIEEKAVLVDVLDTVKNSSLTLVVFPASVAIMDWEELMCVIRMLSPTTKVMILYSNDEEATTLINSSVDEWVDINASPQVHEAYIHRYTGEHRPQVTKGPLRENLIRVNCNLLVDFINHQVHYQNKMHTITPNENRILKTLYDVKGASVSREELYYVLRPSDKEGTVNPLKSRMVDVHIRNLRQKIGYDSIYTVRNSGYYLSFSDN